MSHFQCQVLPLEVLPHDNADALELAKVGDYLSVVRKGYFRTGDWGVYIPEGAVLPEPILERMGLTGKLAGSQANRVKAVRLRGVLSQGLVYPVDKRSGCAGVLSLPDGLPPRDGYSGVLPIPVELGQDVSSLMGIVKYEPPIPAHMGGEVLNLGAELTVAFDVENLKRYPDLLLEGEPVRVTEKVHGTFCGVGIVPAAYAHPELLHGRIAVFSKGLGGQGLCFKDNERNRHNLYLRAIREAGVDRFLLEYFPEEDVPVFVLGEVFGNGVQDLAYGHVSPGFRAFDGVRGFRGQQVFDRRVYHGFLPEVTVLYEGPYRKQIVLDLTDGRESISGKETHLREGVVIRPATERCCPEIGRVLLKSVSQAYLLRKGGTELN
ncbi:RNA ligase (ATP) [Thiomonas sp.]